MQNEIKVLVKLCPLGYISRLISTMPGADLETPMSLLCRLL